MFCFVNEGKTFSPLLENSFELETAPATKKKRKKDTIMTKKKKDRKIK
jgi:hypothetical protein